MVVPGWGWNFQSSYESPQRQQEDRQGDLPISTVRAALLSATWFSSPDFAEEKHVSSPPTSDAPWGGLQSLLRRLTVDEYHRMIQAGIFEEDDPFELLE